MKSVIEKNIVQLSTHNNVQLCESIANSLKCYNEHKDLLKPEMREAYIESLAVLAKARIDSYFCMLKNSVVETYPVEYQIVEDVYKEMLQFHKFNHGFIPKPDIKDVIKRNMARLYSDFSLQKRASRGASLKYYRPLQPGHNFIVEFDVGINRPWACMFIGLDNPSFILDIAKLFGDTQSAMNYTTLDEFNSNIAASLEIVRPLIDNIYQEIFNIIQGEVEG